MTARIQCSVRTIRNGGRQVGLYGGHVVVAALICAVGMTVQVAAQGQESEPTSDAGRARHRLATLQQEAAAALRRSTDADVTADAAGRALAQVTVALTALAQVQPPDASLSLTPELRTDLARAGIALRQVLDTHPPDVAAANLPSARAEAHVDTGTLQALLDRVRAALDGEAGGLAFQGSFSQTRTMKEPVTGGHASAMGPAPAPSASAASEPLGAASSVTFDERPSLPTRTWAGGPTKDQILESAGNGVALLDYDGDGLLDIYLVTAAQLSPSRERIPHRNALYRNLGQWTFEDVSARAGVDAAAWGSGACAGDADGDGLLDLYVTNWGPNFLFRNRGDGTFEDVAGRAGVAAGGWSTGCAFFDGDQDGDLDLYVARYVSTTWDDVMRARRTLTWRNGPKIMVGPTGLPGEADLFFENLGDGRFREVAAARGLGDTAGGYGFGVLATDVDGDGRVDLFVANDSTPNFLYRNLGGGRFESVGLLAGVAVNADARAQAGMGADAGDVDGDGLLDVVLTAFAHDRNTLYRNLGNGLFEDESVAMGLAAPTFARMGWGVALFDADLDGRLDLFVANGHIFPDVGDYPELGESFAQMNQLLLNDGNTFRDVSAVAGAGLQVSKVSRGLAIGDLDNDGDLDLVVSNMDDQPTLLENRQQTGHHWVGVQLSAPTGNRFAIGAHVTVEAGGRRQVREVRSGGSYLSQNDLRVFVGLGDHSGPVSIDVRMPGGARWSWTDLPVDRLHALILTPEHRHGGDEAPR